MLRYTYIIGCTLYLFCVLLIGCSEDTSELQDRTESTYEKQWTIEGGVWGLATGDLNDDGKDEIITADFEKVCTYDSSGNKLESIYVPDNQPRIRVADLNGDGHLEIIGFRIWGDKVTVLQNNGDLNWEFPIDSGVDDIAVYNVDGDSTQEIIVGFNGSTGLYLLDYTGKVVWQYTEIANVWHVSGGDLNSDGSVEVVSSAADGNIHFFNAEGTHLKEINSEIYTIFVYVDEFIADSNGPELITSGVEGDNEIIRVLDGSGNCLWEAILGEAFDSQTYQAACLPQDGLLAIGTQDGQIYIFNSKGEVVFNAKELGSYVLVTWIKDENSNYILVAGSSDGLFAYQ